MFTENFNPSVSCPSKFCRAAKIHKLSKRNADNLPHHHIVSDIGTPAYQTAKYLAKLLLPFGTSKNRSGKKFLLDIKWFPCRIKPLELFLK